MLSLLAGGDGLLRCEHLGGGQVWQEEVWPSPRGLLRVPAPQEGGKCRICRSVEMTAET